MKNAERLPLCRLRFTGVLYTWGFALYFASRDVYADNVLPVGSPEQRLDCAGVSTSTAQQPDTSTNFCGAALPAGACGVCLVAGGGLGPREESAAV